MDPRDRLIVALDVPSLSEAQALTRAVHETTAPWRHLFDTEDVAASTTASPTWPLYVLWTFAYDGDRHEDAEVLGQVLAPRTTAELTRALVL
jgi:hypothetical protein